MLIINALAKASIARSTTIESKRSVSRATKEVLKKKFNGCDN
jgi:hypothetical protein